MTQLQPFDGHRFVFVFFFKNLKSFEEAGLSRRVRYKGPDISLWLEPWPQASAEAQRKIRHNLNKREEAVDKKNKISPSVTKRRPLFRKKTKGKPLQLDPNNHIE